MNSKHLYDRAALEYLAKLLPSPSSRLTEFPIILVYLIITYIEYNEVFILKKICSTAMY